MSRLILPNNLVTNTTNAQRACAAGVTMTASTANFRTSWRLCQLQMQQLELSHAIDRMWRAFRKDCTRYDWTNHEKTTDNILVLADYVEEHGLGTPRQVKWLRDLMKKLEKAEDAYEKVTKAIELARAL